MQPSEKAIQLAIQITRQKLFIPFERTWFEGKKIALAGGADSILENNTKNQIESYDCIVRVNNGLRLVDQYPKIVGTRTDFLFHSFFNRPRDPGSSPIEKSLWKRNNLGKIIFALNFFNSNYALRNAIDFKLRSNNEFEFSMVPPNLDNNTKDITYPHGPTTGFAALSAILQCKPLEIYVTGFTFLQTPSSQAYRSISKTYIDSILKKGHHSPAKEFAYLKSRFSQRTNTEITVDQALQQLLGNPPEK
jgi:hypothetical protein